MGCVVEGFLARWKGIFSRIGAMPVAFLGVGLYRAWLAIFFRFDAFPGMGFADYALFEGAIGVSSLAIALCACRIAPLWSNRRIIRATAVFMTGGSALCVFVCFVVESEVLKWAGLIAAGVGLGFLILMWTEFYGTLNPLRVAVYHAAGIFFGELIIWLFTGLEAVYLATLSVVLPLMSLAWMRRSMRHIPDVDLPRKMAKVDRGAVPWKPILLMAVCTFATGFGVLPDQPIIAGNIVGTLLVTAFVFFGVLSASKWFNFDTIYQLAFPLMTIGLLLIAPSLSIGPQVAAGCYDAGYTMLSMFIMIILSNITYRFGISAAWLNGIERGIRYLMEMAGWVLFAVGGTYLTTAQNDTLHFGITAAVVVAFVMIFATEKRLSAKWGINLHASDKAEGDDVFSPGLLAMRVSDLSKEHHLSPREEEVLQLMARKESLAEIEVNLFVAQGTVKAHISRIYRKLGVHSKEELYGVLGVEE